MAYGDLKVRNLIWNTGSGDNTVVLSTLLTGSSPNWTGTATGVNLTLSGNLTVSGTQTIINTSVLQVEDIHIEIGKVSTPSDTTADGGGIILKASSDRTFLWVNATDAWTSSEHIHLGDNKKFLAGTGSDLQIFHDGSQSYINNVGTGNLYITNDNGGTINLQTNGIENAVKCIENGSVELYYDNVIKTKTTSTGIQVFGNYVCSDNHRLQLGNNEDLQIYHDGAGCNIRSTSAKLEIRSPELILQNSAAEKYFRGLSDGAVELYHDNLKCLETIQDGIRVLGREGNSGYIYLSADEGDDTADKWLQEADASGIFYIKNLNTSSSWETSLRAVGEGTVELYFDNDRKFKTISSGAQVESATGDTYLIIKAEENNSSSDALLRLQTTHVDAVAGIQFGDVGDSDIGKILYRNNTNKFEFITNTAVALSLDNSQNATFTGTVSDSKGDVRKIIQNTQGSSYTLVAADAGKHILASGTVTVPNNIMSAGDAVTIVNNTGSNLTITKSISTMYNSADGSSANRVLANRGMATILFVSGTVSYISGSGLS